MLKKSLIAACLLAVAAPAHATCVIFPCKIKPDPEIVFVPSIPPQVAAGCAYRSAASSSNYCPAGLQPINAGGMVSCGVPAHGTCEEPAVRAKKMNKVQPSRLVCPVGEKGCYTTN